MRMKYIYFILICFFMFSCRSAKHTARQILTKKDIPVITENKLFKNIDNNELKYNTLFAKRIDISLLNGEKENSYKALLKIERDSFIQVSITVPMGIEVARVLFTTDSIKFVDLYHKKYFLADYNYFHEKFDIYLTYSFLQSLLTNTFFNLDIYGGMMNNKKYKLDRVDQGYELSTVEERSLNRKIKKLYKKKRKQKDFILILHRILINPQYFRPTTISMEDIEEKSAISVNYSNFKDFSGKIFPEKIILNLNSENGKTNLELKFQKIDFDVPVEHNLRISPKYKKIDG